MIKLNIDYLLEKRNKSRYWLCRNMNISYSNLNKIMEGGTVSISFKYIEDFCYYLECTPGELFVIVETGKAKSKNYTRE